MASLLDPDRTQIFLAGQKSGNAREVTLRNASLEGVSDRVQIETGDMRSLPFQDASFDLIVSSLAIHNIRSNGDRRNAVAEGFRVLKPGGRIVLVDIRASRLYADALQTLGAANLEHRRLGLEILVGQPLRSHTSGHCVKSATGRLGPPDVRQWLSRKMIIHLARANKKRTLVITPDYVNYRGMLTRFAANLTGTPFEGLTSSHLSP